jgi:hypothetical protein
MSTQNMAMAYGSPGPSPIPSPYLSTSSYEHPQTAYPTAYQPVTSYELAPVQTSGHVPEMYDPHAYTHAPQQYQTMWPSEQTHRHAEMLHPSSQRGTPRQNYGSPGYEPRVSRS